MNTIKIKKDKTKMIAHRGLSGLEKENTLAAFIAAGNRSYYGMECDIHKTKDGEYVVIHDYDTKRVATVEKIIKDQTYGELKEVFLNDIIDGFPKPHLIIPRLEDYIDISIKYEKVCIIEFKGLFSEADIKEVFSIIEAKNYLNNCVFISFTLENLLIIRNFSKKIKLQYLTSKYDNEILNILINNKLDLDINYNTLTKEIVDELKANDILINVWTVDNPIVATMLVNWGVDYITSNILE